MTKSPCPRAHLDLQRLLPGVAAGDGQWHGNSRSSPGRLGIGEWVPRMQLCLTHPWSPASQTFLTEHWRQQAGRQEHRRQADWAWILALSLTAGQLWVSCFTALCLSSLICEMGALQFARMITLKMLRTIPGMCCGPLNCSLYHGSPGKVRAQDVRSLCSLLIYAVGELRRCRGHDYGHSKNNSISCYDS